MVQQVKTFTHNGGAWLRPDIPAATPQPWKCHTCAKDIDSQPEEYQIQTITGMIDKVRFIPASGYWHGDKIATEFCSPQCSLTYYMKQYATPTA